MPESFHRPSARPQAMLPASFPFPVICRANLQRGNAWLFAQRRLSLYGLGAALLLGIVDIAHAEPHAAHVGSAPASADRIPGFVEAASQRFAIPAPWIRAVMQAESGGEVRAVSPKGAMGLMQIMPDTWAELRSRHGLGTDPYDPHDNIIAGTAYLRELHDRFGERGFLAAYNAGPSRYQEHLATGRPLPSETLSYMAAVASVLDIPLPDGPNGATSWASSSLFVAPTKGGFASSQTTSSEPPQRQFANAIVQKTALAPLSEGLFVSTATMRRQP